MFFVYFLKYKILNNISLLETWLFLPDLVSWIESGIMNRIKSRQMYKRIVFTHPLLGQEHYRQKITIFLLNVHFFIRNDSLKKTGFIPGL